MRDLGELSLYIESMANNFNTKKELKEKLEKQLELSKNKYEKSQASIDNHAVNSLEIALSILETTTEEEIQEARNMFND